ncbi:hypothetical protein DICPUDRAFT_54069 [Dictyostelium purpureum]|uniref:CENP-V/GFA domain-containing protein n=1 Tax=Dictyostelium purpureum TaxID=5786 RepID=F0ZFF4_DICPU|nr:uncharacterized protein DICPUDRAFT_54069 [Dictyostelium purpureum]EGC37343.1 hypothetical protein DICPUDRAFT_54069 [Dictyostelium purpureum]|eukprot:XP_003286157.1 hypothetical protein DICPUDRAFT_54069 [Dictyostelium purpureum]
MAEYFGSCHCKKIKYRFKIEDIIDNTTTVICNCSYCWQARFWEVRVFDLDSFEIIEGKESLKLYQFGNKETHHYFCGDCGIHTHGLSEINKLGKPFYFINIPTVENLTNKQLSLLKRKYIDGQNELWEEKPEYTNYL